MPSTRTPLLSHPVQVSIGVIAWNEEGVIRSTLESLFRQSLFAELARSEGAVEVICVANGCTDRTAEVSVQYFSEQSASHRKREHFHARLEIIAERGKVNAWNQFVHRLSDPEARFLFLMDADISIHRPDTLWNMLQTLVQDEEAHVAVDVPCKNVRFKPRPTIRDRLSLAASRLTLSAPAQLCGQLYCIRAQVARNIYLPRDLAACEDGFIKLLVCTDGLTRPLNIARLRRAPDAEHTFEAYLSPAAVLRNQKRQVIGQTIVHALVDKYLAALPEAQRPHLGNILRRMDAEDPAWLKRLLADHLRSTRWPWQLYPGLVTHRLSRLSRLSLPKRLACLPVALAGSALALASSFPAHRALKRGCTDYWPKAERRPPQAQIAAAPGKSAPGLAGTSTLPPQWTAPGTPRK